MLNIDDSIVRFRVMTQGSYSTKAWSKYVVYRQTCCTILQLWYISFGVWEADFFVRRPIKLETKMTLLIGSRLTSINVSNVSVSQTDGKKLESVNRLKWTTFIQSLLLRATNDWKNPWILETFVPTVLTDLSKASDSIKRDILLRKLYDYSINTWCRLSMVHWLSVKEGWYWTMSTRSWPRSAWVLLRDPFLDHYYLCYLR